MKHPLPRTIFFIATLLASISAAAQNDPQLETVIVTGKLSTFGATKSDIPILETARSVSIVPAEEFLERGALTLDDTLNYTSGVVGDTFGYSTRGDFPRVRGLDVPEYLDNIQVLFGFYNNARSDIYTLEQVEILKGPASVLYGQGSPGGLVNTVSKRAGRDNLEREFMLDAGSQDRLQAATDIGFRISDDGKWSGRFVGVYRDSETQVDFVDDDALVLAPSITYQTDRTTMTALVNYTDRESDTAHQFLPLSVSGCADSSVQISEANVCAGTSGAEVPASRYVGEPGFNTYDTESLSVTLFGEHVLNDVVSFEATARYRDSEADYRQTWVSFLGAGNPRTLPDGSAIGRSWYDAPASSEQYAIDARTRFKFETGSLRHEVLVGVNYQDVNTRTDAAFLYARPTTFNVFNPQYGEDPVPTAADFDSARGTSQSDTETVGFYINDQIEMGRFVVTAGLRFDDVEIDNGSEVQSDDAVSFSLGALYKTDMGLNPYISYSESFQPIVGTDALTNSSFEPQEGEQWEVGVKWQPSGTRTYVTAAYFEIEQSNLPNPADLPFAATQQEGVAEISGFEIEGQTVIGNVYLDANFSVLETEDPDGVRFPSIPEEQGSIWATWRPMEGALNGFSLGAGVRYAGENQSSGTAFLADNGFAPTPVEVKTDGYTLFDALVGYQWNSTAFTLNLRNAFQEEYYGTCLARGDCFPGEERTIVARVTHSF
ncbi:TonB-dependent siderophore receptor [Congregibacter brevis]|uniref:TonB-dependent siderophore receptor n=1 Tax=Congregibacter brevis TaxID=3081201 RepID=A0ABZ0IB28_9GAMM|nr:TonB-dependent siderophore receptor [Congregibacter sp. IMCC45268]